MNLVNLLLGCAGFGFATLIPLYAETRYRIGTSSSGTVLTAQAVGMAIVAAIASLALNRTGYRKPMMVGFSVLAASLVLLSISPRGLSPYWWIALVSLASGVGLGCVAPAANNATLSIAPTEGRGNRGTQGYLPSDRLHCLHLGRDHGHSPPPPPGRPCAGPHVLGPRSPSFGCGLPHAGTSRTNVVPGERHPGRGQAVAVLPGCPGARPDHQLGQPLGTLP